MFWGAQCQHHTVAKETKASIQCFLGDTLRVTWNAVNAIGAQHETKGVQFLCRLRENSGDPNVAVCGAVSTGMGFYQMAGGERKAALLHLEWMARLNTLHTVASTPFTPSPQHPSHRRR